MAMFRVPYPTDPERRRALFERAAAKLSDHGTFRGTPEEGTFEGHTPVGGFAGRYHSPPDSGEVVVELTRKPFLVPVSLIEREARRFVDTA